MGMKGEFLKPQCKFNLTAFIFLININVTLLSMHPWLLSASRKYDVGLWHKIHQHNKNVTNIYIYFNSMLKKNISIECMVWIVVTGMELVNQWKDIFRWPCWNPGKCFQMSSIFHLWRKLHFLKSLIGIIRIWSWKFPLMD